MRHDNIEHRRLRPEPFTVEGDLAFVLRTFGMPEDMDATKAEDLFCSDDVLTCSITGKPCVITTWQCVRADDSPAFYTVEAQPVQVVAKPVTPVDPWVKVGTTTIDGDVCGLWESDDIDEMRGRVRFIGGHHLRLEWWETNRGVDIAFCDIVRRQSEIEAEGAAKQAEFDREVATMEARDYPHGLPRPPCPECGPHGNRGEVLLASSWAKCTTCAGGKSGDLWGEVKADKPPLRIWGVDVNANPSYEELRAAMSNHLKDFEIASGIRAPDGRSFMDARREALLVQLGQGFKVPTLSKMRGAELDKLRRYLMAPPDDISAEDFRRMVLGGGTVP